MQNKILIGLGNPGTEFKNTPHNVGFEVIDLLVEKYKVPLKESKYNMLIGKHQLSHDMLYLIKPLTFMNLSGNAIAPFINFYKLPVSELYVFHDDIDLQVGKVKIKLGGGSGGHKGIKSIDESLGTSEYNRIRIGVGRTEDKDAVPNYVLKKFSPDTQSEISKEIGNIVDNIANFIN